MSPARVEHLVNLWSRVTISLGAIRENLKMYGILKRQMHCSIWRPTTLCLAGGGLGDDCIMFFVEALRLKMKILADPERSFY